MYHSSLCSMAQAGQIAQPFVTTVPSPTSQVRGQTHHPRRQVRERAAGIEAEPTWQKCPGPVFHRSWI